MDDRILEHYFEDLSAGSDVPSAEAETLLDALIGCENVELVANVLRAWNAKGASVDEIYEFTAIMRRRMKRVNAEHTTFVDTVGTGGSQAKTFNVSTAAAFVIAGAGLPVAKHGNRAATSNSGSSDVLSALGIEVDIDPAVSEQHLNEIGLCFMFAPRFHSLSPTLARARRTVGSPTIFNNLGPLCNPASAPHHVIGVWDKNVLGKTASVLARLGAGRSWVVHGEHGLDEIALSGKTHVAEICGTEIKHFEISAADFGVYTLGKGLPQDCSVKESSEVIRRVLENDAKSSDAERLVLINAAAALFAAGKADDLSGAYELAEGSVRSGSALEKLKAIMTGKQ